LLSDNILLFTFFEKQNMRFIAIVSIALLGLVFAGRSLSAAEPIVEVSAAVESNYRSGARLKVGQRLMTGRSGLVSASFRWGGVRQISIMPSSSLVLKSYGFTIGNGRVSEFDATGELFFTVITTNPNSRVKVCFSNFLRRRGCSLLQSAGKFTPIDGGRKIAIAVREGKFILQDEDESLPPIKLLAGFYSIFNEDGTFSAPAPITEQGYTVDSPRSKTIARYRAKAGWRFLDGSTQAQLPVWVPVKMLSPLD
jgi:hypothetical protein